MGGKDVMPRRGGGAYKERRSCVCVGKGVFQSRKDVSCPKSPNVRVCGLCGLVAGNCLDWNIRRLLLIRKES